MPESIAINRAEVSNEKEVKTTAETGLVVSGKERSVPRPTPETERIGAFSDGVFAVIITIMVLQLKPPEHPTFAALALLWPTGLSYVVSYFFIAIIWVNHHYLLRMAEGATPQLIWWNFAHLFLVSLVPFSTAWIAESRMAAVPVSVYAAVFALVNVAYFAFEHESLSQAQSRGVCHRLRKISRARSVLTLAIFLVAVPVSLRFPWCGFGLVCCVLFAYLRPEPPFAYPRPEPPGAPRNESSLIDK
jgi:uncharacterized membrane protein